MRKSSDIYFFNPTCEYAVANGNASWQPNRLLQKMESDLATLPMFFCKADDYVLVETRLSDDFLKKIKQLNIELPHFTEWQKALSEDFLTKKRWNQILPWGWSPAAHKRLLPLKKNCSVEFQNSPVFEWKSEYRDFYSKKFALGILKKLLEKFPHDSFIPTDNIAEVVSSKQEIESLLNRWSKLMVKTPWSSSGRGLQPVTKTPVHEKVWDAR